MSSLEGPKTKERARCRMQTIFRRSRRKAGSSSCKQISKALVSVVSTAPQKLESYGRVHGKKKREAISSSSLLLKRQQRQLILLRHAMRCPHAPGECPVTTHCAQAKQLCEHMAACTQGDHCTRQHCASSKYLLSHYVQCGGDDDKVDLSSLACPVCGPVRAAILKSRRKVDEELAREMDAKLNLVVL